MTRLIDADELYRHLGIMQVHTGCDCRGCLYDRSGLNCENTDMNTYDVCQSISECKTVDAIPVDWIKQRVAIAEQNRGPSSDIAARASVNVLTALLEIWQEAEKE